MQYNGKPATIEDDLIELIKTFLEEYPDKVRLEQESKLRKGSIVEIKQGPFAGKKVVVEKVKNDYYIIAHLPMLNRTVILEVRKEDLAL